MEIKEKHYGPAHVQVAITLTNLGNAYGDLGDAHKQKEYLERALEISEKHYGPAHPEVAIILFNLSFAYVSLGDITKAKQFLECAYQIFLNHPNSGPNHPRTKIAKEMVSLP